MAWLSLHAASNSGRPARFGIGRGFVSKGKAHESTNRGDPLSAWDMVATANPVYDLPWVRRGRMSWKAEILPKAHDEKNARRGYQLGHDR